MGSDDAFVRSDIVTDEVARRLISRAIQLDEQAGSIRIEHLRVAVLELGVSEAAFNAAHREIMTHPGDAAPPYAPSLTAGRAVAIGVVAGGVAAAGFVAFPFLFPLRQFAIAMVGMASGALVLQHRRARTPSRFQFVNAALWSGFGVAFGGIAQVSGYQMGLLGSAINAGTYLAVTAIAGMVATNFRVARADSGSTPPPSRMSRLRHSLARVLRRITEKLDPHAHAIAAQLRNASSSILTGTCS